MTVKQKLTNEQLSSIGVKRTDNDENIRNNVENMKNSENKNKKNK